MNEYDYIVNAFTKDGDNTNLEVDNLNVGCITSKNNKFSLDSEGNLVVKSITTESGAGLDFNAIYPVGSIYMSVAATSPSVLFGGTWEQIKDKFLLSCGDLYENGEEGGEKEHTLTISEMPKHKHGYNLTYGTAATNKTTNGKFLAGDSNNAWIWNQEGHTSLTNTGESKAHNNMPPYLTVYIWKRTS